MKNLLTTFAFTITTICFGLAQPIDRNQNNANPNPIAEQEVRKLEKESHEALIRLDVAFFDRILAEDYTEGRASGRLFDKARLMRILKSGKVKILSYDIDDLQVRIYGNTALATGRYSRKERFEDKEGKEVEVNEQGRYVDVWVKRNGNWQLVYDQDTNDAQPKK